MICIETLELDLNIPFNSPLTAFFLSADNNKKLNNFNNNLNSNLSKKLYYLLKELINNRLKSKILKNNSSYLSLRSILGIKTLSVHSTYFLIKIRLEIFTYKLFKNELLEGKITKLLETKIEFENFCGIKFVVRKEFFFKQSVCTNEGWSWNYNQEFSFSMCEGDFVRAKFVSVVGNEFLCKMDVQGLGNKIWW